MGSLKTNADGILQDSAATWPDYRIESLHLPTSKMSSLPQRTGTVTSFWPGNKGFYGGVSRGLDLNVPKVGADVNAKSDGVEAKAPEANVDEKMDAFLELIGAGLRILIFAEKKAPKSESNMQKGSVEINTLKSSINKTSSESGVDSKSGVDLEVPKEKLEVSVLKADADFNAPNKYVDTKPPETTSDAEKKDFFEGTVAKIGRLLSLREKTPEEKVNIQTSAVEENLSNLLIGLALNVTLDEGEDQLAAPKLVSYRD